MSDSDKERIGQLRPLQAIEEDYAINRDGDKWCASGPGFKNIQESPVGFGDTPISALEDLQQSMDKAESERRRFVRYWECSNCGYVFGRRTQSDCAPCPKCKTANQSFPFTKEVFDIERRLQDRRFADDDIERRSHNKEQNNP